MQSTAEPALEFHGVVKRYGSTTVLENFDFTLAPSEKVALIGPSGSGKSTVLRIAMTLEYVQEGSVRIHGLSLWREGRICVLVLPCRARSYRGMVYQNYLLYPHLSVLDNLTLAPRLVNK